MGNRKTKKRKKSAALVRQKSLMETVATDFPFLNDENTIGHVRRSHVMFIMRGLPGSGKSTIVESLVAKYRKAVVCSADNFFLDEETKKYEFNADKLSEAHEQCQNLSESACDEHVNVIIIDNTNVRKWEMTYYVRLANARGYTVVCVIPQTEWAFDPIVLATKNKHDVTEEMLKKKCKSFEQYLPYYWAWCLNHESSLLCLSLGEKYLRICHGIEHRFRQDMALHFDTDDVDLEYLRSLFNRPPRSSAQLHCTAFYAGGKDQAARDRRTGYNLRDIVQRSMGRTFALHVVGFVFTPRTIGARIMLNYRQLLLWANDAENRKSSPAAAGPDEAAACSSIPLDEDIPSSVIPSASVASMLEDSPRFQPSTGRGSRAHLTLFVAPGQNAVTTGDDLDDVVRVEEEQLGRGRHHEVEGGALRYYGKGRCVVYLDQPIRVSTLFSGKY